MTIGLFSTLLPPDDVPEVEGVGFWLRVLARLLDLAVHFVVALLVGIAAAIVAVVVDVVRGVHGEALARMTTTGLSGYVAAVLGAMAMHVLSEGLHGSTIGKRLCGIVVVSESGGRAGLLAALKRAVAFYFDAVFFGFVAWRAMATSMRRQRVGDTWAHTMVVRITQLTPDARRSGLVFFAAALAGTLVDGLVMFVEMISRLAR